MKERVSKCGALWDLLFETLFRLGKGTLKNWYIQESMLPKYFSCRWEVGVNFNSALVHE